MKIEAIMHFFPPFEMGAPLHTALNQRKKFIVMKKPCYFQGYLFRLGFRNTPHAVKLAL